MKELKLKFFFPKVISIPLIINTLLISSYFIPNIYPNSDFMEVILGEFIGIEIIIIFHLIRYNIIRNCYKYGKEIEIEEFGKGLEMAKTMFYNK